MLKIYVSIYKIIINCDQWPFNQQKKKLINFLKQVNYNCNDDYLNLIFIYLLNQIFKDGLMSSIISVRIEPLNEFVPKFSNILPVYKATKEKL